MHLRGADLFAENTTFSANWARWGWGGGAIYALTDGEQDPAVFLHHVTMADNVAGTPLKDNEIRMGSGVLTVKGNIIEDNCPGTSATIVTLGSNTASACVSPGLNDQAVPSALLLPPTASLPHYPLDPASPALGFAKACPAVDQIRTVRPATCDSGSIEQ